MTIRILLRALPLLCVAVFTLAVFVSQTPAERARQLLRLETDRLAWSAGLVKCPETWDNLPLSACRAPREGAELPTILAAPH